MGLVGKGKEGPRENISTRQVTVSKAPCKVGNCNNVLQGARRSQKEQFIRSRQRKKSALEKQEMLCSSAQLFPLSQTLATIITLKCL